MSLLSQVLESGSDVKINNPRTRLASLDGMGPPAPRAWVRTGGGAFRAQREAGLLGTGLPAPWVQRDVAGQGASTLGRTHPALPSLDARPFRLLSHAGACGSAAEQLALGPAASVHPAGVHPSDCAGCPWPQPPAPGHAGSQPGALRAGREGEPGWARARSRRSPPLAAG